MFGFSLIQTIAGVALASSLMGGIVGWRASSMLSTASWNRAVLEAKEAKIKVLHGRIAVINIAADADAKRADAADRELETERARVKALTEQLETALVLTGADAERVRGIWKPRPR